MNASTPEQKWLAIVLAAAMENDIMTPADIILEATPEIMSAHLPPDVMSQILAASLKAGTMTPDVILDTAGPSVLSHYLPPEVLWTSIQTVAARADADNGAHNNRVAWMTTILEEALQLEIMDPSHVVKHTTPEAMAADLPRELLSEVLAAGLDAGNFDPPLVVEVVRPNNFSEYHAFSLLWDCVEDAANQKLLGGEAALPPKPPLAVLVNDEEKPEKKKDTPTAEYDAIDDSMVEDAIALLDEVEEDMDMLEAEDDMPEEVDVDDVLEEIEPEDTKA